jgi:hypothetical protein
MYGFHWTELDTDPATYTDVFIDDRSCKTTSNISYFYSLYLAPIGANTTVKAILHIHDRDEIAGVDIRRPLRVFVANQSATTSTTMAYTRRLVHHVVTKMNKAEFLGLI